MGKLESPSDAPWYADGLRFKCTGCGDCCTGAPGFVWVNQAEIEAMAELAAMSPAAFEKKYVRRIGIRRSLREDPQNYDCVFFDNVTRKCRVYSARPRQCRTWPFWNSNIKSEATWSGTAESCPGCNRGKLYTIEEIDSRAGEIDV